MDCGDAGHILVSRHVAEDLAEYERWRPFLHDIGTFEVKHGVQVNVANLYSDQVGNPQAAEQTRGGSENIAPMSVGLRLQSALLVLAAIVGGAFFSSAVRCLRRQRIVEKSIAVLPFENLSDRKSKTPSSPRACRTRS